MRDNTVGSLSDLNTIITDCESAYILGLWCADGYYWSSSVGITNIDRSLVERFSAFLQRFFPKERIKLREYHPMDATGKRHRMRLAKHIAYQLYVNSRPLLRLFQQTEMTIGQLPKEYIYAYFAGRFDGDGSIDKNLRSDLRIAYSARDEAMTDLQLLNRVGWCTATVYTYATARTNVLYISRYDAQRFLQELQPFSMKIQSLLPRRDSVSSQAG